MKPIVLRQPAKLLIRGRSELAVGTLNTYKYIHPCVYAAFSKATPGLVTTQRRWASEASEPTQTSEEKHHRCPLCEKQFLGKIALENHMAIRHNQRTATAGKPPKGRGSFTPQSFQSLIDGYEAKKFERIDRKKYSKEPLIINGKPETEEERKARLKKVIEEREKLRHKSVSVTDIPLVLGLAEMWDDFALKIEEQRNKDLEEGEIVPPPHVKYVPVTMEQITAYILERKQELGYDEDAHSWMSDGIPLSVFKTANDKKREKQSEELKKVHFGSRQLNSMSEPNPYKQQEQGEVTDLPFKCGKCGKGYRSKMSMEFHFNTICSGKDDQTSSPKPEESRIDDSGKSVQNMESTTEYFEGVLPMPIEATKEEREIVNEAKKEIPLRNPFDKQNASEKIDIHSIPEEWQIAETHEKVTVAHDKQVSKEHTAVTAPSAPEIVFSNVGGGTSPLGQTSSAASNPFAAGTGLSAQPTSKAPNPFAAGTGLSAQPTSKAPNSFAAKLQV